MSCFAYHGDGKRLALPHGQQHKRLKGQVIHPDRLSFNDLADIARNMNGHSFTYQYLQGQYKTRFGDEGHGCIWLSPQRDGEFWDARTSPKKPYGFYHFTEQDLMLPKVFGIGADPCPPNMRDGLTPEELEISLGLYRETMLEHQRKIENGELDY